VSSETPKEDLREDNETNDDVEVVNAPTQDFEVKYTELLDRYQRTLAEFDNYRKRTVKELSTRHDDGLRTASEKLLPMVDNFERALNAHENKEDTFFQGVSMIKRQLEGILNDLGVQVMDLEIGTPFNPNFHNAVAHIEDENLGQSVVAEILQKGYMHKDKVLRHSMVKVAN